MKILVVSQYYYPEPFRISDICKSLVQNGHKVTVLTGLPNYPEGLVYHGYQHGKNRVEVYNGVQIIRCFVIGRGKSKLRLFVNYFSFVFSASLKALSMKQKFDVLFVYQLSPVLMTIPAIVYKRKHHKKIILYCLDIWPASLSAGGIKEGSLIYKLFFSISKWIYKSADMILVTSKMFLVYFQNILRIDTENIEHLPQFAEYLFSQSQDLFLNNKFNLVFAGNIGDMQSVDTIVKAANELHDHTSIVFHIVGTGSKLDEWKYLADSLGLTNVIFYGRRPVEEMSYFYGISNAMLVTLKDNKSISYTLPGKVQSYLAAGKPIIGSINGETRRVIEESNCGFCCPAEDYKGLANIILQFSGCNKKEQMAVNAKKFYFENYSKIRFMTVLEDVLMNFSSY